MGAGFYRRRGKGTDPWEGGGLDADWVSSRSADRCRGCADGKMLVDPWEVVPHRWMEKTGADWFGRRTTDR